MTYEELCAMAADPVRKHEVGKVLPQLLNKPQDIIEFMRVYWRAGRGPVSKQVRVGLAAVFERYSMKDLALNEVEGEITLRGVLSLVHAKVREE